MSKVSARKTQTLYVLTRDQFWWLTTLATNRAESWASVAKYASKKKLQDEGYTCVPVQIVAKREAGKQVANGKNL